MTCRRALEGVRGRQNRDTAENPAGERFINPASLISVSHYDGTPITARFIVSEIGAVSAALNVRPLKKHKAA